MSPLAAGKPAARKRLAEALRRLQREHGRLNYRTDGSAVGELVATILSQNTSAANSSAGYRQLWRRFRSWHAVADAPVDPIERCIRVSGLARVKAPRIKKILQQIRQHNAAAGRSRARLSLDFLRHWPTQKAYQYLLGFEGVGPKTAACVLLFAFGKPVFPVDTHILRIAVRLGVLRAGTRAEQAQDILTPLIRPAHRLGMHLLLITHGRRTCRALGPHCDFCRLLDLCPTGKRRLLHLNSSREQREHDSLPVRAVRGDSPSFDAGPAQDEYVPADHQGPSGRSLFRSGTSSGRSFLTVSQTICFRTPK